MMQQVHLGFEVGTGSPVQIPLRNLAITGQTQESGKTTTLEALVSRAGVPAIAFVTKRGESAFSKGRRLQPYFRDRADWQFVTSIIDATLQEKNKFLRPWIMRICRTTRTLADVQREVRKALKGAKGINEGVYTQLDAYLDLIVPEIGRAELARALELEPGLNVMDVSGYPTPMQMLFVQSAIDWVNEHETATVVVVPEAWEFIPEGKSSPVKASAIALARKGSGIGNHIWIDSQDMAGVDKTILRGCPVWLIGVQREANEIKRNLANIPAGIRKPNAADIAGLERGQFYACWKDRTLKVYVQPTWLTPTEAQVAAQSGRIPDGPHFLKSLFPHKKEESVTPQEAQQLTDENRKLKQTVADLHDEIQSLKRKLFAQPLPLVATAAGNNGHGDIDEDALYQRFKARLIQDQPSLLTVIAERPELRIEVQRRTVEAGGDTLRGRIALLLSEGFFDSPKAGTAVESELRRRGFACSRPNCYRESDRLAAEGFLTKESEGYAAVAGMKINIVEAR